MLRGKRQNRYLNNARLCMVLLLNLQPRVHADDAADQVPISMGAHPVGDDDARAARTYL